MDFDEYWVDMPPMTVSSARITDDLVPREWRSESGAVAQPVSRSVGHSLELHKLTQPFE
jgi:hypothetical protein